MFSCLYARYRIPSTYRLSTRAVSEIVSPRPTCRSSGLRNSAWPPSCVIPTSNETRVRVEAFSKIIARLFPRSGSYGSPAFVRFFMFAESSRSPTRSFSTSSIDTKSRFGATVRRFSGEYKTVCFARLDCGDGPRGPHASLRDVHGVCSDLEGAGPVARAECLTAVRGPPIGVPEAALVAQEDRCVRLERPHHLRRLHRRALLEALFCTGEHRVDLLPETRPRPEPDDLGDLATATEELDRRRPLDAVADRDVRLLEHVNLVEVHRV